MTTDRDATGLGRTPGLPEEHFVHDGLITKHPVRAVALAALRPAPPDDVGTALAFERARSPTVAP